MPPHAKVNTGSRNELFLASFEKIVVWPLLVDFGYFSNYIWLQAAQEPTNPETKSNYKFKYKLTVLVQGCQFPAPLERVWQLQI
jgi:hypothetical protein